MVLLMEIRYRDAPVNFLPEGHKWWRRDKKGKLVMGWKEGGYIQLDFTSPSFRQHVVRKAEKNLAPPRINCLETWYHRSRNDLNLMRAVTTLSLTHSDGYCLFSDPNPLPSPDHLHNWYPLWNKSLGRPKDTGRKKADGSWHRVYDMGTVVYNPKGNKTVTITFPEERTSMATGRCVKVHSVNECDGDIFLK